MILMKKKGFLKLFEDFCKCSQNDCLPYLFMHCVQMPNLNKDENAFFHKKFYYYIRDRKLKQKEGQ